MKKKRIPKPKPISEIRLVSAYLLPLLNLSEASTDDEIRVAITHSEGLYSGGISFPFQREKIFPHVILLQKIASKELLTQDEQQAVEKSISKLHGELRKAPDGTLVIAYPVSGNSWERFQSENFRVVITAFYDKDVATFLGHCKRCDKIFSKAQVNAEYCGKYCIDKVFRTIPKK